MQFKNTFLLLFIVCFGASVSAQKYISKSNTEVSRVLGHSNFTSSKTFFENIEEAPDFTILAKILKIDPARSALEKQEMVTIFAIADESFMNLPKKPGTPFWGIEDWSLPCWNIWPSPEDWTVIALRPQYRKMVEKPI